MNGARTTFMRRGYLLTALAAAVLLAASPGSASAQISIGFTETSGMVDEHAVMNLDALNGPTRVTVRANGLAGPSRSTRRSGALPDDGVSITATGGEVTIEVLNERGTAIATNTSANHDLAVLAGVGSDRTASEVLTSNTFSLPAARFDDEDELVLLVTPKGFFEPPTPDGTETANNGVDPNGLGNGSGDNDWRSEMVQLKLASTGTASVSPDVYRLTINDDDVAPVAAFHQSSFTLTEGGERSVSLDIVTGQRGEPIPNAALGIATAGPAAANAAVVTVRVSNSRAVTTGACPADPNDSTTYGKYVIGLNITPADWDDTDFENTGLLKTATAVTIGALAAPGVAPTVETATADLNIEACGDAAGISNPEVMLEILDRNLAEGPAGRAPGADPAVPMTGSISVGPPLMVTVESDEAAPTLSFSPTDVTIDEGGSTDTVLLSEGMNADQVGMVKLMVEGDAMVDLYQDGEMLEEMGGYVMVDLGGNSSARLTAMSMSDPDLMDGDTAYKAWKLMEGETGGAATSATATGSGSTCTGSTAVPALPLVGQLLLALFLMAGGSRLYRRRQG